MGEVGREEIDAVGRGSNLGWPWREGAAILELEPGIYLLRRSRQGQVQRLRVE